MVLGTLGVAMTSAGCGVALDPVQPDGTIHAIAILAQDVAAPSSTGGDANPLGIPDFTGFAPDSLVLMWSNAPESCSSPEIGGECADAIVWQGSLVLPPDLVHVGTVDLSDPRISAFDVTFGNSVCAGGGGGGGAPGGTMDILSTDATSITVDLIDGIPGSAASFTYSDGTTVSSDVTLKGTFAIPRCGPSPTPPP
jgi:hypothetical protein